MRRQGLVENPWRIPYLNVSSATSQTRTRDDSNVVMLRRRNRRSSKISNCHVLDRFGVNLLSLAYFLSPFIVVCEFIADLSVRDMFLLWIRKNG
jgi:hypothetical protein